MATRERRSSERVNISLPATVERLGHRSLSAPATTVDLGEGGVQLVASAALAVGDVVKVFIGNGDLGVSQQGLVVGQQLHAGDQAAVNIAFRTPTEVDAARLRDLIDLR